MGLSKAYLVAYNVSQFCGWTYLMYRLMPYLTLQAKTTLSFPGTGNETSQIPFFPAKNPASLYEELGCHVKLVQTAAILEIVHAAIGIVRSNPMIVAVQIASRLAVVWLPIHFIAAAQTSPGMTIMLFAWCLTEMVRYSYYAVNLVNLNIGVLTWLRYTLFIVLYPMGVSGEMWCYISALPFLPKGMEMPNPYNFTFSPYVATLIILLGYAPGFPPLYFHMFSLRRKVVGGETGEAKAKKVA